MSETKTPILHGVCQGDFDFAGYRALNLNLDDLASGAPFIDNTALIRSSDEETALGHFKLDFTTPGVHRVYTLPNYNATMATLAGVEAFTNKTSYNGVSLSGSGGMIVDAAVSLTGGLLTEGDVSILSAGELILRAPVACDVTLPASGTLARLTDLPTISDVAYNAATWNGNLDGATKNAIRDKFESLTVGILLPPFDDTENLIRNKDDNTKLMKFSLAGLTTATVRTLTVPNKNGTLAMLDDIPDTAGIIFESDLPDRTLYLAGNAAFFGAFTLQGGYPVTLEASAITFLTLPEEGTVATRAGTETFTNKTLTGPVINAASVLGLRSSVVAFDLRLASAESLGAARTLSIFVDDADRNIQIGGDVTFGSEFTTLGAFPIVLTATDSTALTLPTAGTVPSFVSGRMAVSGTAAVILAGNGAPTGSVVAPVGSLYMRTNGGANTTLYVKESGSDENGWVAK